MIDATPTALPTPRSAGPARARWLPLACSLVLHALVLGLGVWLYARTDAAPAPPERAARLALVVPREAESVPPPPDLAPLVTHRPQDVDIEFRVPLPPPPREAPAASLDLPEEPAARPMRPPLQLLAEVPIEAVKVRVKVAPPPPLPPSAVPAPPAPAGRARPGAPLRVTHEPDLRLYYPREMQLRGIEGRAVVQFSVDRRGRVVRAHIVRSSGWPLLDRQALRVMYDYRFAPGDGGEAQRPVHFTLR